MVIFVKLIYRAQYRRRMIWSEEVRRRETHQCGWKN